VAIELEQGAFNEDVGAGLVWDTALDEAGIIFTTKEMAKECWTFIKPPRDRYRVAYYTWELPPSVGVDLACLRLFVVCGPQHGVCFEDGSDANQLQFRIKCIHECKRHFSPSDLILFSAIPPSLYFPVVHAAMMTSNRSSRVLRRLNPDAAIDAPA
jgi:hypothetical protein